MDRLDPDFLAECWAGVRALLSSNAALVAQVPADRIVDHAPEGIAFPYIRLGRTEPVSDDTADLEGVVLAMGLEVHSRPDFGRMEVAKICGLIRSALHLRPDELTVTGCNVIEIEVQTFAIDRSSDGVTWRGVVALEITLDAG